MSKRKEDPNGSIDRAVMAEYRRALTALGVVTSIMDDWSNEGMIVDQIVLQGPEKTGDKFLAIIKGIDEGRNRFVAFRSGSSVKEVMTKIADDAESGRLMFKEEQPYDPTRGKGGA